MGRKKAVYQSGHQSAVKAKQIGSADLTGSSQDQHFRWDTSMLDVGVTDDAACDWTWRLEPDDLKDLMQFLSDSSNRTWSELEGDRTGNKVSHKKHHQHPVANICNAARKRFLDEVGDESHDMLFRFRYGGTQRLWGLRDRAVFHIVWIDLNHKVYPTEPG
ncbi:MAG: hypothetical protein L0H96_19355 [Humibacillus sp.]|nr:hypothetical protein [Humibacillus sp.]MDN5779056.1 hypothetical protein [Humibacillus sp.]